MVRLDPERHDEALAHGAERRPAGVDEGGIVADDVIGGDDKDARFRVLAPRQDRPDRDRRGRVARRRLDDDLRLEAEGLQLLGDDEAHVVAGDDHQASEQRRGAEAPRRQLEARQRIDQRSELLRRAAAR